MASGAADGGPQGGPSTEDAGQPDGGAAAMRLLTDAPAMFPPGLSIGGAVELSLLIDEAGEVAQATVVSSTDEAFTRAALHAAPGLRFTPLQVEGVATPAVLTFTYRFEPPPPPPPPPPAPPAQQQRLATVSGLVRARGTRAPLALARVESDLGTSVETDEAGRFTLQVPPGTRWFRVTANAHLPGAFKETLLADVVLDVVYGLTPRKVRPFETVVRTDRERTEVSRVELKDAEIREVPGTFGDPFRVVMLMPGVSGMVSGLSYPVVRGSGPAATGYFIDGVRVPQLFHVFLGPAVIHPDFIDGLDFYAGGAPVRYGRLTGGVVDGRLARRTDERVHATAYADLINAGGFVEVPIAATGTRISAAGRVSYAGLLLGAISPLLTGPGQPSIVAEFWDYQVRAQQPLWGGRAQVFAFGSYDGIGSESNDPALATGLQKVTFHRLDAQYRRAWGAGDFEGRFTAGTDLFGFEQRAPIEDDMTGLSIGRLEQTTSISQTTYTSRLGYVLEPSKDWTLTAGGTWDHVRAGFSQASTTTVFDGPTLKQSTTTPVAVGNLFAGWTEAIFTGVDKLTVQGGLRVDHFHLVPRIDHTTVDPRLFARYDLTDRLALRGAFGIFHQPPTFLISLPVVDVASLRWGLQEVWQSSLGATWKPWRDLEVSVDGYLNPMPRTVEIGLFGDPDDTPDDPGAIDLTSAPSRPGQAMGVDVMVRWPMKDRFFGWATFSAQRSTRLTTYPLLDERGRTIRGQTRTEQLPYAFDQTFVANLVLSYRFDGGYSVGTTLHFNTGRPENGDFGGRTRVPGTDTSGSPVWNRVQLDRVDRLPPFFRADFRVSKTWVYDAFTLEAWLDVLNATVSAEVLGYSYRRDRVTRALVKEVTSVPIVVPSLGFKVRY